MRWQFDYLLLTDADIAHGPTSVRDLVAHDLPLASVMVKLRCESWAERLLVPAFVFFFFKLYPPSWIADPEARTAGAAGGCILIKPDVLARIGGIEAIRGELIDDCALARAVKRHGPIWLGMSAGDAEHPPIPHLRCDLGYGRAYGIHAVTSFDAASAWSRGRDAFHVPCAACIHVRRLLDRRRRVRGDVHRIYSDVAVLRPACGHGAAIAGRGFVLSGRDGSFGRAVLDWSGRAMEGPGAGSASVDFHQLRRRCAAICPAFRSVSFVLGVYPAMQRSQIVNALHHGLERSQRRRFLIAPALQQLLA